MYCIMCDAHKLSRQLCHDNQCHERPVDVHVIMLKLLPDHLQQPDNRLAIGVAPLATVILHVPNLQTNNIGHRIARSSSADGLRTHIQCTQSCEMTNRHLSASI
jgi:hypothetical protein